MTCTWFGGTRSGLVEPGLRQGNGGAGWGGNGFSGEGRPHSQNVSVLQVHYKTPPLQEEFGGSLGGSGG